LHISGLKRSQPTRTEALVLDLQLGGLIVDLNVQRVDGRHGDVLRAEGVQLDNLCMQSGHGRTGSQTVPLHKFNTLMDIGTSDKAVGVCLWGPPGCGKSSAISHIKTILQTEDLICVNSDDWVEFLASNYFTKRYAQNCAEKHRLYSGSAQKDQINAFLAGELEFKEKVRNTLFTGFRDLAAESTEKIEILPDSLYDLINKYFLVAFKHTILQLEWDDFKRQHPYLFKTEPNPGYLLYDIVPWWAKLNQKHFVLETTGRSYNPSFHRVSFGDVSNVMYIPFVGDLDILKGRVQARKEQFGNPDGDFVENVFKNAYGQNLVRVLDSGIYDQIVVQGNNFKNYVMISLEKMQNSSTGAGDESADGFSYILVKEFANDLKEALYIKELLHMLYIPAHLHDHQQLVYDSGAQQWSIGVPQP